ncbi:N-acetylmuramoyl-L-alanine amidase [Enterococcus thailandicus]|uniref:N-acetylmuramoyl-L-alanine amidase n=1 Tax=Enterococcus thailandicus TaxID=417368 RepID=UPI0035E3B30E
MKKKFFIGAIVALFLLPVNAFAYTIDTTYQLGLYEGSPTIATNNFIVGHETGNLDEPSGEREAIFMKRNWANAYVQYIVGDGKVYKIGEEGYISYGAGDANWQSPVQVELQHTTNQAQFNINYPIYVNLLRNSAIKFGIPLILNPPVGQRGIVTHYYITKYIWQGDWHVDPDGYLAQMGVSMEQFARDLQTGLPENNMPNPNPTPNDPTRAGAGNSTLTDGVNYAHIDQFGEIENANLHVAGWHVANYKYEYIFIMDYETGKELARVKANGVSRPDVNSAYGTSGNVGYHISFNMRRFPNKKVYVMMRATNDSKGNTNGGAQDFHDSRWYLNIPKR